MTSAKAVIALRSEVKQLKAERDDVRREVKRLKRQLSERPVIVIDPEAPQP